MNRCGIDINEHWTSHGSRKHKKLAKEMERALVDRQFQVARE